MNIAQMLIYVLKGTSREHMEHEFYTSSLTSDHARVNSHSGEAC
jgi:hypothetical protein